MLNIYPGFIDNTDFRYINIDGKYTVTMCIVKLPKRMCFMDFMKALPKDIEYEISLLIRKQDTIKVLKELTYNISNSGAELKSINNNQIDVDLLSKVTNDAKKLRYEIQINNEQIYNLFLFLSIKGREKDEVIYTIKKIKNILHSKMYESNILNFRHLHGYLHTLPLNKINESIFKSNAINMTTSNIANMFTFFTDTIFDKNGVIFGYTNDSKNICNIDVFNNKYTNSNICVFGSSGSGKSYFVKLLILRQHIANIRQYIFDPEGEYVHISSGVGGEYVNLESKDKSINILDITNADISEDNFLCKKIESISEFLIEKFKINSRSKDYLFEAIKKAYSFKGINDNIDSVYLDSEDDKIYFTKTLKGPDKMPVLEDIFGVLKQNKKDKTNDYENMIKLFEKGLYEYDYLNKKTTIDLSNNMVVFNFSKLNTDKTSILFEIIINRIIGIIKNDKKKTMIYIDEAWRFIQSSDLSAEKVFTLFKTIRKINAGILTITQDISDFFTKDLGSYGKSIINNSFIKVFFKMEYADTEILDKIGVVTREEINEILKLSKGSMTMLINNNIINLNIRSNEYEDKLIKGEMI